MKLRSMTKLLVFILLACLFLGSMILLPRESIIHESLTTGDGSDHPGIFLPEITDYEEDDLAAAGARFSGCKMVIAGSTASSPGIAQYSFIPRTPPPIYQ